MESLKLDDHGDLVIDDLDIDIIEGLDEIIQTFTMLLRTNLNEWFLNPNMGFDYSVINGMKIIDEENLAIALNDTADQMKEIDRIENIEIDFNRSTRKATVTCTAYTVEGLHFEIKEVF